MINNVAKYQTDIMVMWPVLIGMFTHVNTWICNEVYIWINIVTVSYKNIFYSGKEVNIQKSLKQYLKNDRMAMGSDQLSKTCTL